MMTLLEYTAMEIARGRLRAVRRDNPITEDVREAMNARLRRAGAALNANASRRAPSQPMTRPCPTVDELRAAVARLGAQP